jgi:glycerate 2-kinase
LRKFRRGKSLFDIYFEALTELAPRKLLGHAKPQKNSAILCWGKAAEDFRRLFPQEKLILVISPENSDHPIPGKRSFQSGQKLVRFFRDLHSVNKLDVYLSGGASSLAWIPVAGISRTEVVRRLTILYRKSLDIRALNKKRAKLCELKSGGAARMAKAMHPRLKIRVFTVSDVSPFGAETLGGAPFFSRGISHRLLADNQTLRKALARKLDGKDLGFIPGSMKEVFSQIQKTVQKKKSQTMIFGCEPGLKISSRHGKGGRQTHLACLFMEKFSAEIRLGMLEILCMSSDGVDGTSGGSGAFLSQKTVAQKSAITDALRLFNTARLLKSIDALVPSFKSATNVQDIVVIRKLK